MAEFLFPTPTGLYRVDVLLGDEWLGFEADGYYHFTPERHKYDKQRDANILERFDLPIVRLTGKEVDRLYSLLVKGGG